MKWIDANLRLPEVGQKVLCFKKGDVYVAVRFEDKFVPMPFATHTHALALSKPDKWAEITFPPGYTGKMRAVVSYNSDLLISEQAIDIPAYKKQDPEKYLEFANSLINSLGMDDLEEAKKFEKQYQQATGGA